MVSKASKIWVIPAMICFGIDDCKKYVKEKLFKIKTLRKGACTDHELQTIIRVSLTHGNQRASADRLLECYDENYYPSLKESMDKLREARKSGRDHDLNKEIGNLKDQLVDMTRASR